MEDVQHEVVLADYRTPARGGLLSGSSMQHELIQNICVALSRKKFL
jgi:hypothetical protein